jgi:hypothetical protein
MDREELSSHYSKQLAFLYEKTAMTAVVFQTILAALVDARMEGRDDIEEEYDRDDGRYWFITYQQKTSPRGDWITWNCAKEQHPVLYILDLVKAHDGRTDFRLLFYQPVPKHIFEAAAKDLPG